MPEPPALSLPENVTMPENQPNGAEVYTLRRPGGPTLGAGSEYALLGGDHEASLSSGLTVRIDARTGNITVVALDGSTALDYEALTTHSIVIVVQAAGAPIGSSPSLIEVLKLYVTNVNEPPVFGDSEVSVDENFAGVVDVVYAEDPDEGDSSSLSYSLAHCTPSHAEVNVTDSADGGAEISVISGMDFERTPTVRIVRDERRGDLREASGRAVGALEVELREGALALE